MSVQSFADWLSMTPVSMTIQNLLWVIPVVQSVHILAIAILVASAVTLDLHLVGATSKKGPSLPTLEKRFIPWFWGALCVLVATGLILIIGEPVRELLNWAFWTKMVLVVCLALLTFGIQLRLRRRPATFEPVGAQRWADVAFGGVSILIIGAIITAGRWIAYVIV